MGRRPYDPMLFIIDSEAKRTACADFIRRITSANETMQVEIKPYRRNRSTAQNRLMWMYYGVIAHHIGCEPEDLHEQMKIKVLGTVRKVILGQAIIMPVSTTTLDVDGMIRFLEAIEALALDLDITLPNPDDRDFAMKRGDMPARAA